MFVALVTVSLVCMLAVDYKDGVREGPRPTRVKLIYGLLLLFCLYHMVHAEGWVHLKTYYDAANALFGPMSDALFKWFKAKG
ncbi:hypothetical protein [Paenibacillus glycinis]|uniref:Uncharacterized protein n=1 Tax=Paenibacillus glycinis TaxID=2697035 RepID=A0ABW9XJH5_9BACL|nr:hypothetical protein [Paenibacillus glycinis]NBD22730.1 hypothetical protein [Paenibacillus glycinis]